MLGLQFFTCNHFLFSVSFEDCNLNLTSFYKLNLKRAKFTRCSVQEVDFTEVDLSGAMFDECNLFRATFDHTNIEKADFRTSVQYAMDPEINKIKKAKFSRDGAVGLLAKYDIEIV